MTTFWGLRMWGIFFPWEICQWDSAVAISIVWINHLFGLIWLSSTVTYAYQTNQVMLPTSRAIAHPEMLLVQKVKGFTLSTWGNCSLPPLWHSVLDGVLGLATSKISLLQMLGPFWTRIGSLWCSISNRSFYTLILLTCSRLEMYNTYLRERDCFLTCCYWS